MIPIFTITEFEEKNNFIDEAKTEHVASAWLFAKPLIQKNADALFFDGIWF